MTDGRRDLIYGRNPVMEALESGVEIEKILIQKNIEGSGKKIFSLAKKRGVLVQAVEKAALDRILRDEIGGGRSGDGRGLAGGGGRYGRLNRHGEDRSFGGRDVGEGRTGQVDGDKAGDGRTGAFGRDKPGDGLRHQGVIAYISAFKYTSVEGLLGAAEERGEPPFILVLDGIEDPHNLGAILRSAEGAGAHGVVIPKRHSASVTDTVVKVSAGAALHIPVARVSNLSATLDELKDKGLWIYGLDMTGDNYSSADFSESAALVIGGEGKGLGRLIKEKCDMLVSIPMKGKISSLNASNAAAIVMFEISRRRGEK